MRKSSGIMSIIAILLCIFVAGNLIRGRKQEDSCEHVYGAAVTVKNPTCEEEGAKKMECLICGEIYAETIPSKGGHMYIDKEVISSPTCLTEGVVKRECLLCKVTTYDRIPKTEDHQYDLGVEMEDYMLYTCTLCGTTKTGEIHHHKDADFDGKCDSCAVDYDVFAVETYTEVDVVEGESIVGNWYRLYRPLTDGATTVFFTNIAFVNSQYEPSLTFISNSLGGGQSTTSYISWAGYLTGSTLKDMNVRITDEYIDVYLAPGTYIVGYSYAEVTATIDEESKITKGSSFSSIKRLVFN